MYCSCTNTHFNMYITNIYSNYYHRVGPTIIYDIVGPTAHTITHVSLVLISRCQGQSLCLLNARYFQLWTRSCSTWVSIASSYTITYVDNWQDVGCVAASGQGSYLLDSTRYKLRYPSQWL